MYNIIQYHVITVGREREQTNTYISIAVSYLSYFCSSELGKAVCSSSQRHHWLHRLVTIHGAGTCAPPATCSPLLSCCCILDFHSHIEQLPSANGSS